MCEKRCGYFVLRELEKWRLQIRGKEVTGKRTKGRGGEGESTKRMIDKHEERMKARTRR